ncbi:phage major capsid protein [Hydrocarboniphaga sp.]|uniref:phage major capsid protein n=1 Tax=Hydrocarboniphaga sp. TaxID=2033016 RepID=UPI003D0DAF43
MAKTALRKLDAKRFALDEDQRRDFVVRKDAIDVEARTVDLAFASEEPYSRWWGVERLSITSDAMRMERLANGAALLMDHDTRDQVGVVVRAWVGADKVARAVVRFGRSARAEEIFQDVQDGIRKFVSVGYRIHEMLLEKSSDDGDSEYRVTDWEPFELSFVAVPADATVGVGRARIPVKPLEQRMEPEVIDKKDEAQQRQEQQTQQQPNMAEHNRKLLTAERERCNAIRALGKQHGQGEIAERAIEEGTDLEKFRATLLDKIRPSENMRVADDPNLGMSQREIERFSFRKVLLAAMEPHNHDYRKAAAFEFECSEAARGKQVGRAVVRDGGLTIPADVLSSPVAYDGAAAQSAVRLLTQRAMAVGGAYRDLVAGTPSAGGNTVATNLLASSFIDLLRNKARVIEIGATLFRDLSGNLAIPRQNGTATTYWVGENTSPTESQQTIDQVTMTPKTLGAFTDYSRRLLLQSSIDIEVFVRLDLATLLALGIDFAALFGTGTSNMPLGMFNTSGIGAVIGGTNGAAPTWDHAVQLEEQVAVANADSGRLAYLTNAKVRSKLKRTQKFSGTNGQEIWLRGRDPGNGIGEVNGYDAFATQQVPSNLTKGTSTGVCSAMAFGNWSDLLIGLWGGLDVMLDPYTGSTAGTKRVVALQDCDVTLRRASSFAAMVDVLTT